MTSCRFVGIVILKSLLTMKSIPSTIFALLCIVMTGSASSEVKDTTYVLSCCANPNLRFNPNCECSWADKNEINFAHYNVDPQGNACRSPCKALQDGLLTLDQCVEVNADCDCDDGKRMEREIIQYHPQPCGSAASGNVRESPSFVLMLLCLMIAGGRRDMLLENHRFWLFLMAL